MPQRKPETVFGMLTMVVLISVIGSAIVIVVIRFLDLLFNGV